MARFICVLVVVGIAGLFSASLTAQDAKADDQAKDIYGQFFKAVKAKDLDGAMKVVEVPWVGFSKDIIRDEKELKKTLKELIDSIKDPADLKTEIKEVLSYAKFREKFKDKDKEESFKLLDELKLAKDDRVILEEGAAVLIRIRDGKAKVVGVLE